ncbi:MAG: hypothetical protein EIB84_06120 [Spiroplasma poulsonii]|uniref:Uncharacterized protein n=1 Tax=Spiroplasma poulsonii TaxID=2138 RepID=A0A2P6FCV3_9MOLU|nr:hypothetical protein [Spiroplasma poulsonii]KAF0851666.1 hypothetical protein MSROBK_011130 [Spiroplasma poulsonii]MBW1242339.1 hypothetical protein [Spiroplasma poulsonii]PQM31262.1 hypothetical protein SMSRO_SF010790 [Spiroplasma poulsonii]PWF96267.1 hypothetical protein SMSE_17140 [Spiroplasma poulsonii]PWF99042.1 hypothetical protein SMH99_16140 [Spiroplasma poulsonii]
MDRKQLNLNDYIVNNNGSVIGKHVYEWNTDTKVITLKLNNGNFITIGKSKKSNKAQEKALKVAKRIKKWDDKYNQVKKPFLMKKWKWDLKKEQISKETLRNVLAETVDAKRQTELITSNLKNKIEDTQQEQQTSLNVEKPSAKKVELSEIEILDFLHYLLKNCKYL